jgi:hypothetical protein
LAVTYAYCAGARTKTYEQLCEQGADLAKAHGASWSATPAVVQRIFTAKELPAIFDIAVPTPKGKQPAYPRMLFVRREVLAPGQKPLPLPDGSAPPAVNAGDELKTLPNPFLIGIAAPLKAAPRPTVTRTIALQLGHAVSKEGEVAANHFIKWLAQPGQTWIMLVGGDLKELPPAKDIAAARVAFPVVRGKKEGATKACVALLKTPFEAGKPYDYAQLGEIVGSTAIPKQPDNKDYDPPKEFKIDVTRAVKQISAGEATFRGFALRTEQDRAVDEGWYVRFDLPPAAKITLELDVYAEAKAE